MLEKLIKLFFRAQGNIRLVFVLILPYDAGDSPEITLESYKPKGTWNQYLEHENNYNVLWTKKTQVYFNIFTSIYSDLGFEFILT